MLESYVLPLKAMISKSVLHVILGIFKRLFLKHTELPRYEEYQSIKYSTCNTIELYLHNIQTKKGRISKSYLFALTGICLKTQHSYSCLTTEQTAILLLNQKNIFR